MKPFLLAALVVVFLLFPSAYAEVDVDELKNPFPATEASLAKGGEIYIEKCGICHGEKHDGNGPSSGSMQAAPWSFIDGPILDVSDGYLFQKIKNGGIWFEMAPYALIYSDEEIWHTINFIRSLVKK